MPGEFRGGMGERGRGARGPQKGLRQRRLARKELSGGAAGRKGQSACVPAVICRHARATSSTFIVVAYAANACADSVAASIFSCPISMNSLRSRASGHRSRRRHPRRPMGDHLSPRPATFRPTSMPGLLHAANGLANILRALRFIVVLVIGKPAPLRPMPARG